MKAKKHEPYTAFRRAIAGKGLTFKDVAASIGVNEGTFSKKVNGESDFYLAEIRAICRTFGLDESIFFTDAVA